MSPSRRGLAALALLALTATACEDPDAGRAAVRRASPSATATPRATTAPPRPPAPRATAQPTPAKARVVRQTTQPPRPASSPAPRRRTVPKPQPLVATTCGAPSNPWGYNFCGPGSVISDPPATFCTYFDCIDSFWENTNGYVMRCDDGMYSHSGGRRGSCSWHDGNDQPLYG